MSRLNLAISPNVKICYGLQILNPATNCSQCDHFKWSNICASFLSFEESYKGGLVII